MIKNNIFVFRNEKGRGHISAFLFLIANSGMAVSTLYCGGSLASIDFFSGKKHNCPRGEKPMKSNCCEDHPTILKASDNVEKKIITF